MRRGDLPQPSWIRLVLIHLASWALIGCSPGVAGSWTATPPRPAAPATTSTPRPTPSAPLPSSTPVVDEASPSPIGPTPTVRKGLHATDPGMVVLASGKPQLVEFFAFW